MRIIGFGTYDARKHPRVGVILEGMRQAGESVLEINAPLGLSTAERVDMVRRPWRAARLVLRLLWAWSKLVRGAVALRGKGRPDAVIVGYLGHFDVVLARLLFGRSCVVLDHLVSAEDTARDRKVGSPATHRLLRLVDSVALACAHVVLVDTDENRRLIPERLQHKVRIVPVGAGAEWFAARRPNRTGGPLRVVFYGLFTPLQGARIIGQALAMLKSDAKVEVTMVGTGQDYRTTRAAAGDDPRVTWVDWVPSSELADLVGRHDACLGIFGTTPKAQRVVPNKVFQGAAAGCAIITSDSPPQRRVLGDAAVFVPAGDAQALFGVISELAADEGHLTALRQRAAERADESFGALAVVAELRSALKARGHDGRAS